MVKQVRAPRSKSGLWLTVFIIFIGLALVGVFGLRATRAFQELRYARETGLLDGTASLQAIRPWMTIRYVAVAYAVPEEYIFAQLKIPFDRRNRDDPLGRLNRNYQFGDSQPGEDAILEAVREAIISYRENPVATGLDDVRPWMSVQYVANSTGVPADYIFEAIGIEMADNAFKPLDMLAEENRVRGGPRALADRVKAAVQQYGGER